MKASKPCMDVNVDTTRLMANGTEPCGSPSLQCMNTGQLDRRVESGVLEGFEQQRQHFEAQTSSLLCVQQLKIKGVQPY